MAKAKNSKPASTGNSPIAGLASKATTASATASNGEVKQHPNFTGQYFLERFITQDESETAKMDIVRQAVKVLDIDSFKKSMSDMVELARKTDLKAGIAEKVVTKEGPTYRNAANVRSILTRAFGALRFAPDALKEYGFDNKTGFHKGGILARKALETKKIKWTGEQAEDAAAREQRLMFKREEQALAKIKKAMPRQPGQSLIEYENQCLQLVHKQLEADAKEAQEQKLDKYVNDVLALDPDLAREVAKAVLAALDSKKNNKNAKAKETELA